MDIYKKEIKLLAEHVDFKRRLKFEPLMHIFQEAAIAHTEILGMGRSKTLDKGFLWIITNEKFQINRLPEYDEEIEVISYPGTTLHYFFPRYLLIKDKKGNVLIKGTSMWALIDQKNRKMIDPGKNKIVINGKEDGSELPPLLNIKTPTLNNSVKQKVTYSKADLNGHMNNACYLNLAMDLLDEKTLKEKEVSTIDIVFKKEIKLFDEFITNYDMVDNKFYLDNDSFTIRLTLK